MKVSPSVFLAAWLVSGFGLRLSAPAAEKEEPFPTLESEKPMPKTEVEQIAAKVRPSLLTVINAGREGYAQGIGAGFVISKDGLVVTNLHVVGEARPISVELQDGRRPKITEVVAWSRRHDLIVFRMDTTDLPPLRLGPPEKMAQGASVVAMGNPLGLRYSVVSGVVSETRTIDAEELIQVAMPIERGNSGGPLVDSEGRVRGIINMKSAVTENLGYAIPVKTLQELLDNPAPVKMENWLTIGALNPKVWKSTDAEWTQRAGRILAHGTGEGFGGRALCLHQAFAPQAPYEVSVRVKLDEESGAAGLAFCAEDGETHYGFYPTAGKLRLTRFEGPDVAHWTILEDIPSQHYRKGDWNHLRVRLEPENITCYLNGHQVIVSTDTKLRSGRVGLCKFRQTEPEFKDFRIGAHLGAEGAGEEIAGLRTAVRDFARGDTTKTAAVAKLSKNPGATRDLIEEELKALEQRREQLQQISEQVHESAVQQQIVEQLSQKDESKINLAEAALLVARMENPDLDVATYLAEIDRLAADFRSVLTETEQKDPDKRLDRLIQWMFKESGFHGSQDDYYSKSNSYLNEVIDDREGIPITLSILFMELSGRADLTMAGISMPGQFVVQFRGGDKPKEGAYIDVFENGARFDRKEAERRLASFGRISEEDAADPLEPASKRDIVLRMLRNLIAIQLDSKAAAALPYLNLFLALSPDEPGERLSRAIVLFQSGRRAEARQDVEWLLEKEPPGINLSRLQEWLDAISRDEKAAAGKK